MQDSKYLVANDRDAQWGLVVNTVGYDEVGPDEDYPTKGHGDGYFFDVERISRPVISSCCFRESGIRTILCRECSGRAIGLATRAATWTTVCATTFCRLRSPYIM